MSIPSKALYGSTCGVTAYTSDVNTIHIQFATPVIHSYQTSAVTKYHTMSSEIKPFDSNISQTEVDRLFRKLADTRLPTQPIVPDAGEDYGPSLEWVQTLYNHWLNKFDWGRAQKQINAWNHFTTEIEGLKIHFIHQKAERRDAVPLLLVHGWPGTWFEYVITSPL